jgi:hypothetical protein
MVWLGCPDDASIVRWRTRNGVNLMLTLLLSLHVIAGPTPVPARAPMHYKIMAKTNTEIDLTAMGQPSQNIVMTVSGFVSVTMTDTAGGQLANVTVDSSTFDAGMYTAQMPPGMTASSQGTVFHVYLVNGKPNAPIAATPVSVQAAQLVPGIELMLAGMRPTRLAESWVDTTKSDTTMAQGGASSTRITTWTAKAGTGGRIQTDGTWTAKTTATIGGGQMEMQMTGAAHVTAMPGALSENGSSSGSGQANMNIGSNVIPMKVSFEVTTSATP